MISLEDTARDLYGGGWRPTDAELMAANYAITLAEAEDICSMMQEMMEDGRLIG